MLPTRTSGYRIDLCDSCEQVYQILNIPTILRNLQVFGVKYYETTEQLPGDARLLGSRQGFMGKNLTVCSLGSLALELRKVAPSVLLVSFAAKTK